MRARMAGPSVSGSRPSTVSAPPERGETQAIIRIVDDFPAPLGPRKPNTSPRATSTSMPRTASNAPKLLRSPRALTSPSPTLRTVTRRCSERREPELDLAGGALRRVGAVDEVVLGLQREVAPDRAGRGLLDRVGAARDLPPRRDRARALDDGRHHRPGSDELQQALEERLAVVLGVVLAGQLAVDRAQVHRDDVEALALDAGQDLADQLAAHAVGLDEDESAFSHGAELRGSGSEGPDPRACGPLTAGTSHRPRWLGSSPRAIRRATSRRMSSSTTQTSPKIT